MSLFNASVRAFLQPIVPYLDDDSVTEILINNPEEVWIERAGVLTRTNARFTPEALLGAARNIAQFVGRVLSDERPQLDARLPDGSRIHVVLAPIARSGPTMSIRKFSRTRLTLSSLVQTGVLTHAMARLLEVAIGLKLNIVVSGGTGCGKTTLLNVLTGLIPSGERIVTLEDSAELQISQPHVVSLESRPPDRHGRGGVDLGELLLSALRLRPDRIVVGEVRGGECFHLLQAVNTGHGGTLCTCHANGAVDALRRLESLALMSDVELPLVAVRAQVAAAFNLVVSMERLRDGTRRVTGIAEVLPLSERGDYRAQELFAYAALGQSEAGQTLGYHAPTGLVPRFAAKARAQGYPDLDDAFFDPRTYHVPPLPLAAVAEDGGPHWAPSLRHRERGEADPDTFRVELIALERQLREEATRRTGDGAPSHGEPEPLADADKTPPPTRNPLRRPPGAKAPAYGIRGGAAAGNPRGDERPDGVEAGSPTVELAEDLLGAAQVVEPSLRRSDPGTGRARPAPTPDPNADPDRTHVKSVPGRWRR